MLVGDSFVSTVKLDNNNDSDYEKRICHPRSRAQCGRQTRALHQNVFQAAAIDFHCALG